MSIFDKLNFKNLSLGRMQVVDDMSVIPLIGPDRGEIAMPTALHFKKTVGYGNMVFENKESAPAIVPANYMVRGLGAQDHAMVGAAIVSSKKTETFNNACCIESSQGGYLGEHGNEEDILPISLRKILLNKNLRDKKEFSKLWEHISRWLQGMRLKKGHAAHLRYFYDQEDIKSELENFAAEFEPLDNQIGAIIFFSDIPVGLEIMPSSIHWRNYWKQLIRGCYGAELIRLKRLGKMTPSTLVLPEIPEGSTPEQVGKIIYDFNVHLSESVIPILDKIDIDQKISMTKKSSLTSSLIHTKGG
jgi:hypothetical protein